MTFTADKQSGANQARDALETHDSSATVCSARSKTGGSSVAVLVEADAPGIGRRCTIEIGT